MFTVAAFYQFAALPDYRDLREPLRAVCAGLDIKGTVLLASEGINGTVAGSRAAVNTLIATLGGDLSGGRLGALDPKFSTAQQAPFARLKVRLKREIVTLGDPLADPAHVVGAYVDPADWNALIEQDDVVVIDTRNAFEVALGSFEGAVDPGMASFGDFKDFARTLRPSQKIAMFCTGGIRCEKASAHLLARGFTQVHHLKGGILNYLEKVPEADSRWRGECFVFDDRIALGHGLRETRRRSLFIDGAPDA